MREDVNVDTYSESCWILISIVGAENKMLEVIAENMKDNQS